MDYKINDIFLSVQGEGYHAGMPMCFVRLSGCNLNCSWCDTDHSAAFTLTSDEVLDQVNDRIEGSAVRMVCITGGEPTIYELAPLISVLRENYLIHIETNGTRRLKGNEMPDWVTVSPKFPPGLKGLNQLQGDELKLAVWPGLSDSQIEECSVIGNFVHRFLQPVDGPDLEVNAERCLRLACDSGAWLISFQGHKRLRLP